jgi:hypothetical protein
MNKHIISLSTNVDMALAHRAAVEAITGKEAPRNMRRRTRDHALPNFYNAINQRGDMQGNRLAYCAPYVRPKSGYTMDGAANDADGMQTVTYDSTGAFLVGELERLDYTMHMPLTNITYSRDIDMREDVTIADENTSFTYAQFASAGGLGTGNGIRNGKAWISKEATQVSSASVDIDKVVFPLHEWGLELKYSILELASAAQVGRPIDQQKLYAINKKHEMDIDEQVYVGDAGYNETGLFNNARVTNVSNLPNGAAGSPLWTSKTPNEILADVNATITNAWTNSAFAVMPNRVMLPPQQFAYINSTLISTGAGNISILTFLLENNMIARSGQGTLEILPSKWLIGAGAGGTLGTAGTVDRMVAYNKNFEYVRYPMTGIQRTPIQYDGMWHKMVYYCRLGVVELVYPETMAYRDGL